MVDLLVVRKGGIQSSVNEAIAAQKNAANGIAPLDAQSKVPAANSRVESVAGRQGAVTLGVGDVSGAVDTTDTRLSNARTPTAHKATHEPGGADALSGLTNASIAANASIAKTKLAALAIADADVSTAAAIAETKLALASDGPAGTATRRSLGAGAQQAAAGNDTRFHTRNHNLFSSDHPDVDAADAPANLEVLTFDAVAGKWKASPAGGVLSANEDREGTTRQATAQQIIDGTPGNLFPTAARLAVELDRRGPMNAECELSRTANQGVANSTLVNVLWNSEVLDPRNWHDNTTNPDRITPDAAGRYSGVAYIVWVSSTVVSNRRVRILRWAGGVAIVLADSYVGLGAAGQYTTTGPQSVPFNTRLALGDYLTVEVFQNTGAPLDLHPVSTFSMARVL